MTTSSLVAATSYDGRRCGQLHTSDRGSVANDATDLTPDPSLVRRFDVGMRLSLDRSTPGDLEASK